MGPKHRPETIAHIMTTLRVVNARFLKLGAGWIVKVMKILTCKDFGID